MSDLRAVLSTLGATEAEVDDAERTGTLLALAARRFLLPGDAKFTSEDVAQRVGISIDELSKLWLALGFPQPSNAAPALTDRDVDVMRMLVSDGTTVTDYTLHEARVISSSLARIAEVLIDEIWDDHFAAGQTQHDALREMADGIDVDRIERLLLYLLRRQLVAAIYRRVSLHDRSGGSGQASMVVGFADMAGFTELSHSLTPSELTRLVVAFERTTFDLVAELGGRVVKTIGDEVMFTFDDLSSAAELAVRLTEIGGTQVPPTRIGLSWGPVIFREGDCFGPTVNLASRVVGIASPGGAVVDHAFADQLAPNGAVMATPIGDRDLKGFGPVSLWALARRARSPDG